MERSEKQLSSKENFRTSWLLNNSDLRLKQCERPWSYKNFKEINFEGICGKLESKKVSRENNSQNM